MCLFAGGCLRLPEEVEPVEPVAPLVAVDWGELTDWNLDDALAPFQTFKLSCRAIGKRDGWQHVCKIAKESKLTTAAEARIFFEKYFAPWQVRNPDGSSDGLITGYYGPELVGRRERNEKFRYPLYKQPDDMLIIDLDSVYPALGDYRLRGRIVGNRVVPYFARSEIDGGLKLLAGSWLFWLADPVELFFLHIQG